MQIYNENKFKIDFKYKKDFDQLLKTILEITKKTIKEFYVNLVDENEIKDINKKYRDKDSITDVISFRFDDNGLFNPIQGEIYICIPRAITQSNEYNHSFKRELCFLFTHGVLHLLGYDHIKKEDEKEMFSIQDKVLEINKIFR